MLLAAKLLKNSPDDPDYWVVKFFISQHYNKINVTNVIQCKIEQEKQNVAKHQFKQTKLFFFCHEVAWIHMLNELG